MENNLPPGTLIIPAASQFAMRKARELTQIADRINFQYAGAAVGSRARDFRSSQSSQTESQLLPYSDRLRIITRLRQLVRDDPYAAALLSAYPTQIGTSTMSSLAGTGDAEADEAGAAMFNDAHESGWSDFSKRVEYCGLTLAEVEAIIWREDLISGEIFFLKLKSGRLQMIPSEYCFSSDDSGASWGKPIPGESDGIVTEKGIVTGYRFGFRDESGTLQVGKSVTPAADVIHFFFQDRPEQRRGVPRLSAVLNVIQDIFEICGAKVTQVKTQSFIAGVVTKNYAPGDAADLMRNQNSDGTRSDYQDIRGGALYYLETGEDMKPFQSNINANDFDAFLKSRLGAIGGAVGMPPECWIEGFGGSNYSSARATVSTWIRTVQCRRSHLVSRFLEALHGYWVEKNPAEVRAWGAGYDAGEVSFAFPGVPAIDEGKQNESDAKALAAGLTTYAQVYGAKGQFWDTQFKQIQREQQRISALKIVINFAPNSTGAAAEPTEQDNQHAQDLQAIERAKAQTDAYGVGVRAGVITPVIEDEDFMREQIGLPATPEAVREEWEKEKTRRPITIAAPGGGAPIPAAPAAPAADPDAENEFAMARDELRALAKTEQTIDQICEEIKAKHHATA